MTKKCSFIFTITALLLLMTGCQWIDDLRKFIHPEEATSKMAKATLHVDVTPKENISIILDGKHRASTSPFISHKLKTGRHILEVKAPGYHSFKTPIVLESKRFLTIPVSLRPRTANPADANNTRANINRTAAIDPPEPPAPILPAGVSPILLKVLPEPVVPILLDGFSITGRDLKIERVEGELIIGVMKLTYRVGGKGLLFLRLSDDDAQWFKHNLPMPAGATVQINAGSIRLRRTGLDGTNQAVLIRR